MNTKEILQGIKDWAAPKVIYDISAAHNNAKYTDLSDALGTDGGNIPQEYRKGGVTVRYVQSSDNKYVQFRCMAQSFTTDVTQWQGVDDEPTAGSDNLVKSGGIKAETSKLDLEISSAKFSKNVNSTTADFVLIDEDLNIGKRGVVKITNLTASFDTGMTMLYKDNNGNQRYILLPIDGTAVTLAESWDIKHIKIYIGNSYIQGTGSVSVEITKNANIPNTLNTLASEIGNLKKPKTGFYVCSTNGNVAAKEVSINDFALSENLRFIIRLNNINTADNVTLNINNTGAKPLYFNGLQMSSTNKPQNGNTYLDVFYTGSIFYSIVQPIIDNTISSGEKDRALSANMGRILNLNFKYAGTATPSTNPGTHPIRVFYVATEAGTYTNFKDSNNNPLVVSHVSALIYRQDYNDWRVDDWGIPFESESSNDDDFLPKLNNLRLSYKPYGNDNNTPCLTFLHLSDLHNDNNTLLKIKEYADSYAQYIDDVIQTGDINDYNQELPSAMAYMTDMLGAIGNHEASYVEGGERIWVTSKQVYDKYISLFVSNWGVTQPTGAAANGYNYYYKDYTDKGVRLIVLDSEFQDSTQYTWFENVLSDARTNNLHVVCAIHRPPFAVTKNAENVFCSIDYNSSNDGLEFANRVASFITAGGYFVCWLCGHIHDDVMGVSETYPNQLVISIACASYYPSVQFSSMKRSLDDYTRDCFNFVGIDTVGNTIKIMRVGANFDRYMRKKVALSWNYSTGQLIYNY